MKREALKELGLTDEIIDKIMAENGKDIEKAKGDFALKESELASANTKISELTDAVKKFDGVDIEKLKSDAVSWEQKYTADLGKLRLDHALETALRSAGAHDPATVAPKLDSSLIKLDGDKLLGLDEQLARVKQDAAYLFASPTDSTAPRVSSGVAHGSAPGSDPLAGFVASARAAAGLQNEKGE